MSASLDDIPPYERFQIELDDCLVEMLNKNITLDAQAIHQFIEYITFQYFISSLSTLPPLLIEKFIIEHPSSKKDLFQYLMYLNQHFASEHQNKLSEAIKKALT
jgi:hypothetical protein